MFFFTFYGIHSPPRFVYCYWWVTFGTVFLDSLWILLTAKLTGCENSFLVVYGGGWTLSTFHAFMFVQGFIEEVTRSR